MRCYLWAQSPVVSKKSRSLSVPDTASAPNKQSAVPIRLVLGMVRNMEKVKVGCL